MSDIESITLGLSKAIRESLQGRRVAKHEQFSDFVRSAAQSTAFWFCVGDRSEHAPLTTSDRKERAAQELVEKVSGLLEQMDLREVMAVARDFSDAERDTWVRLTQHVDEREENAKSEPHRAAEIAWLIAPMVRLWMDRFKEIPTSRADAPFYSMVCDICDVLWPGQPHPSAVSVKKIVNRVAGV